MASLIHASNMSLDGYTEDERGAFEEHRFGSGVIYLRYRLDAAVTTAG